MKPTIRKIKSSEYWRIGEHESWFTDMAGKGYHLKKWGYIFAHFEVGDPKNTRYRISVSTNKVLAGDEKQKYARQGWEYVTSYHKFHVFSSPDELNAPEFVQNQIALKEFYDKLRLNTGLVTALVIINIGLILSQVFFLGMPFLNIVEGQVVYLIISTALMGYLSYSSIKATVAIHKMRKIIISGHSINHRAPWEKQFRNNKILGISIITAVMLASLLPIIQFTKWETQTLPEVTHDLPIVRLAEIEQDRQLIRESDTSDGLDWLNHYTYEWSFLAPIQYETTEHGKVPGELVDDKGTEYSPSIHSKTYQLTFSFLTDGLVSDVIKWNSQGYRVFVKIEHPKFDKLYVGEEDFIEIVAAKGKAVMYIRYFGRADIDTVLENVAEKLSLLTD